MKKLQRWAGGGVGVTDASKDGRRGQREQSGVERDAGASLGGASAPRDALPQHVFVPGNARA